MGARQVLAVAVGLGDAKGVVLEADGLFVGARVVDGHRRGGGGPRGIPARPGHGPGLVRGVVELGEGPVGVPVSHEQGRARLDVVERATREVSAGGAHVVPVDREAACVGAPEATVVGRGKQGCLVFCGVVDEKTGAGGGPAEAVDRHARDLLAPVVALRADRVDVAGPLEKAAFAELAVAHVHPGQGHGGPRDARGKHHRHHELVALDDGGPQRPPAGVCRGQRTGAPVAPVGVVQPQLCTLGKDHVEEGHAQVSRPGGQHPQPAHLPTIRQGLPGRLLREVHGHQAGHRVGHPAFFHGLFLGFLLLAVDRRHGDLGQARVRRQGRPQVRRQGMDDRRRQQQGKQRRKHRDLQVSCP